MNNLKNLRGTVDLLPDQLIKWQNVEKILLEQLTRASIKEIRTPILEMTELFIRGIGEGTDVVSKEMYTFLDRGGKILYSQARRHSLSRTRVNTKWNIV